MKTKYFLTFKGNAAVRALGRKLKDGDRFEITPEQARHFNNARAKALGIKIVKVSENNEKKKEEKTSWSKKSHSEET